MKSWLRRLSLILVSGILWALPGYADIPIYGNTEFLDITSQVEVGVSHHFENDPKVISFTQNPDDDINVGYSAQDQWLRFTLKNMGMTELKKYVFLDSPLSGRLKLYSSELEEIQKSGPGRSFFQRAVPLRLGAFEIKLQPLEKKTYIIKRHSHHALNTKVIVAEPQIIMDIEAASRAIFMFYLGGILCLVIYNLILSIFTSRRDFFIYSLFAMSFAGAAMASQGVFDTYLFAGNSLVISNYLMAFSALALATSGYFVLNFLNIKKDFKVGYWGLKALVVIGLFHALSTPFLPQMRELFFLGYSIDIMIAFAVCFYIYCGIYVRWKYKNRLANYFLLSWAVVAAGMTIWIGTLHGFIPTTPFTSYALLFANLAEMLVLSLGLGHKIKELDIEKQLAQVEAEDKERYHRLVRVLSHDVANTASGLMYHGEMLQDLTQGQKASVHADRVVQSITQLTQILKSVRQEEVFFSVRSHAELEPLCLQKVCREALEHCQWESQKKKLKLVIEVPEGKFVRAEKNALINQVILNVLSNAIKFSEEGRKIVISFEESASQRRLLIRDQGVGIHPSDLTHLFKNKKLISRKGTANEEGSGIGTTLMAEYMRLFGGDILIESVHTTQGAESGTTVILVFPHS